MKLSPLKSMGAFIVKLAEAKQDMNFDAIHDGPPSLAL